MANSRELSMKVRVIHRYLGFFLAGIMAVYALSGIALIFRDSEILKTETVTEKIISKNLSKENLGKEIGLKKLHIDKEFDGIYYFKEGTYNKVTGASKVTKTDYPFILGKLNNFHKAKSGQPLFFLNIFFGLSLLFFVISSFWMFMPKTPIFKKGLYFTLGGIILTVILLFI
ncbi:hypothetical protein H0I23_06425 [Cellulophaga sp. HaHaR_3_176]|uniref:hypothetical protein n=1 Tax=Cellulophaga sp. HaHaR_3_176 TaxID=1942464 RepID=UPI001C1F5385|nr:hypothetical protein [Cellulophaga sp. HaHaR_3_176]QWX85269.1 hypothetical protein H0I23_06425 [Cellulophaga sp. HaHaR_3_176]